MANANEDMFAGSASGDLDDESLDREADRQREAYEQARGIVPTTQLSVAGVDQSPMALLHAAMERGYGPDVLRELMALKKEWEADEARKAFYDALSRFRAKAPVISKNKVVDYTSRRTQERTHFPHATLDNICRAIDPLLAEVGMSYRWRPDGRTDKGELVLTCVLSHRAGHTEETTLMGPRDESGQKNTLQGMGSTQTYLQRYTLLAALGLSTGIEDDDGRLGGDEADGPDPSEDPEMAFLTANQVADLRSALDEVGLRDATVCKTYGVARLEDLRQRVMPDIERRLKNRRAAMGGS